MTKIVRTVHIRPPLKVKTTLFGCRGRDQKVDDGQGNVVIVAGKCRQTSETDFHLDKLSPLGGATVLITGQRGDKQVELQVAFCRPDETYNKKLGRQQAALKEKTVIDVTELPRELLDIDHQMLSQFSKRLQKNSQMRSRCTRGGGYASVMYQFLPYPLSETK